MRKPSWRSLGEHRGGLRVGRRAARRTRKDWARDRSSHAKTCRGEAARGHQAEPDAGQLRAERRRPGLQVKAAELAAPGVHRGEARAQLGEGGSGPAVGRGQLGPGKPAQQRGLGRRAAPPPAAPGSGPRRRGAAPP